MNAAYEATQRMATELAIHALTVGTGSTADEASVRDLTQDIITFIEGWEPEHGYDPSEPGVPGNDDERYEA